MKSEIDGDGEVIFAGGSFVTTVPTGISVAMSRSTRPETTGSRASSPELLMWSAIALSEKSPSCTESPAMTTTRSLSTRPGPAWTMSAVMGL